jgi:hypothetical protein
VSKAESITALKYDATIKVMKFEWDKNKAASNLSKHSVSLDEAKTIFDDPLTLTSTIRITLMLKSVTSLLGCPVRGVC